MMERAKIDGLTIAYERAGTGSPLVLLHGGLSDHREWRNQIDDLSDSYEVVAWDTPGCGGSDDPPAGYRMSDYAARLAALIEHLGIERPNVLGLSWGSTLALALYELRPDLPRTLILTAAYAGWAGSLPPDQVADRLRTALHDLDAAGSPEAFVRTWVPSLFSPGADQAVIEDYVAVMAGYHDDGVRRMLRAMAATDLRPVLPTIAVPTFLVFGEMDERSPRPVAEALHQAIRGSELVFLPGVGHMSNLEAPDAFNAAVRDFLDRHRSSAGSDPEAVG
jgi:pimeloyl-ACP methyl ester carboxylesterase